MRLFLNYRRLNAGGGGLDQWRGRVYFFRLRGAAYRKLDSKVDSMACEKFDRFPFLRLESVRAYLMQIARRSAAGRFPAFACVYHIE